MSRYYQTTARIASGLAAFVTFLWLLWPSDEWRIEGEPTVAFLIAIGFWILTEFKHSEEVVFRASTPNDIRVAREMLCYLTGKMRTMLKDHDFHRGIESRYLYEIDYLLTEVELDLVYFQDRKIEPIFQDFCYSLKQFDNYLGVHSSPEEFNGRWLQSIKHPKHDDYNLPAKVQDEISETNRLASEAWATALPLIRIIRQRVPEAFDHPIQKGWVRTKDEATE
ncbi:hypothetical protein PH7735_01793 [Shimia thalassica]|uniref:Uncharacterized protein n=1 Tax=Shimia thalassica TaxID=1715693 RepID=A0A0P1I7B6_9RHOB|nr:hypothetical protein [Shimia thalassica]CUJ94818.1 hypothetical protein PH7735_01793 [Shimia thalassica]